MAEAASTRARLSAWAQHEAAADILRDLLARCAAASLRLLPVKGVVTAHLLYDDVSDRRITDVDVRIRPSDFAAFRAMARSAHWRCLRIARSYGNLIYAFPALTLDVECHVGPPGLCALGVDDMIARAAPLEIAPGLQILAPEIHDHALLLTVNAFKDKIIDTPPGALADLERIVRNPAFIRDIFVERVVRARSATLAWIVAEWLREQRGSVEWGAVGKSIEARADVRRRYARLFQRVSGMGGAAVMPLRLLARAAADDPKMRIAALARSFAWALEMQLRAYAATHRAFAGQGA